MLSDNDVDFQHIGPRKRSCFISFKLPASVSASYQIFCMAGKDYTNLVELKPY